MKTEIIAYKADRIFFTFPDRLGTDIDTVRNALARHGIFLDEDDDESEGYVSKAKANALAGVKLGGSKWIYTDWIDMEKSTKDIPAALQKVQAELPFPAEVLILE